MGKTGPQFRRLALEPDGLHYYLVAARPRYLLALLVPSTVLLGWGFARLGARSRPAATVLGAAVLVTGLGAAWQNYGFYRGSMRDLRSAARFLEGVSAPVYTDDWARMQLPLYLRRPVELRSLVADPPAGALVLAGGSRGYDVPIESVARGLPEAFRALHLGARVPSTELEVLFELPGETQPGRRSNLVVVRVR